MNEIHKSIEISRKFGLINQYLIKLNIAIKLLPEINFPYLGKINDDPLEDIKKIILTIYNKFKCVCFFKRIHLDLHIIDSFKKKNRLSVKIKRKIMVLTLYNASTKFDHSLNRKEFENGI